MGGSWAASGGSKRPAERLQPRAAWDVGPLEHLESDLVRGDRDSTRELVDGGDRLRSSAQQAPRFDPAAHRTSSRASDGEYRHAVWTDEASRSMPETQYARTDDGYVAFEVFASGPFDLLFSGNWASNVEVMWEHPSMARFLQRLGRFARVICSDKRGAGLGGSGAARRAPHARAVGRRRARRDGRRRLGTSRARRGRRGPPDGRVVRGHVSRADSSSRPRQNVRANASCRRLPHWHAGSAAEKLLVDGRSAGGRPPRSRSVHRARRGIRSWSGATRYIRLSAALLPSTRMYRWVLELDVRSVLVTVGLRRSCSTAPRPHYRADGPVPGRAHPGEPRYDELPRTDWYPPFLDSRRCSTRSSTS